MRPVVENLVAIDTEYGKRVIGVEFQLHDVLTHDGNDLNIDTSEFLRCPVSGCRWVYDPEFSCPEHGGQSS